MIKRINLAFNLEREDHLRVYNIISSNRYKTEYVVNTILNNSSISINTMKEVIEEVLKENKISIKNDISTPNEPEVTGLPTELFDMLEQM